MAKQSKAWLHEHHHDAYVKRAQREGYPSRAAYKLLEIQAKDKLLRPGMQILDVGAAPGGWSKVALELVAPRGRVIATDLLPLRIAGCERLEFIQGDMNDPGIRQQLAMACGRRAADVRSVTQHVVLEGTREGLDQHPAGHIVESAQADVVQNCVNDPTQADALDAMLMPTAKLGSRQMSGDARSLVDGVISDIAPNLSGNKSIDQPRMMQLVELTWYTAQPLLQQGGFFLSKIFQGADVEEFVAELKPHFKTIKWRKPAASRARSAEVYLLAQGYKAISSA